MSKRKRDYIDAAFAELKDYSLEDYLSDSGYGNKVDRLISLKEASRILSCSRKHLYNLKAKHKLPMHKVGNATRVYLSDIKALVRPVE